MTPSSLARAIACCVLRLDAALVIREPLVAVARVREAIAAEVFSAFDRERVIEKR